MHYRSVFYVLGSLLLILGAAMVIPLITAFIRQDTAPLESYEVLAFLSAIGVALFVGFALRTVCDTEKKHVGNREGAAIVSLTWILFSAIGCLPYVITGAAGFSDAFFETMSGFTTTGATILTKVEVLPSGLQLWRHQTQWMGGMGIVVLSVAVLPLLGVGAYRMFKAEAPGGSTFERNAPRIKETAKVLWGMYLTLSSIQCLLLLWGGMSSFDAVCHTFTTMSTGGFSTNSASIAAWPSPFIQWTIVVFMVLAGCNFGLYQQLITGPRRNILHDSELRTYLGILLCATTLIAVGLWSQGKGAEQTIRDAAFSVTTISSTTGFGTEDFNKWPDSLRLTLVLLMFVGGSAGSTSGGMKVIRLLIFAKAAVNELRHSINPRAVLVVRVGDRALDRDTVSNVMGFFAMWIAIFAIVSYALTLMGIDLLSATTAAAANLGNIGPGLGTVGPASNYAHLPLAAKWLLSFCMLLGRLELYSTLVLLLKRSWVR